MSNSLPTLAICMGLILMGGALPASKKGSKIALIIVGLVVALAGLYFRVQQS